MNRDWILSAVCIAVGFVLSGCVSRVPERAAPAVISIEMQQRAEVLKKAVGNYTRGVVVGDTTRQFYLNHESVLARRCRAAGFSEVYIDVIPEKLNSWFSTYSDDIKRLIAAMHDESIYCFARFECNDLFSRPEKASSWLKGQYSPVVERVGEVVKFNSCGSGYAFDGLEPIIMPSWFSEDYRSDGLLYRWAESSYGRRGENDILMQRAIRMMSEIRKAAGDLEVAGTVADFYHDRTLTQDLTRGQPRYFLRNTNFLIIWTESGQADKIFENVRLELKSVSKPQRISVRLKLDRDIYGSGITKIKAAKWKGVVDEISRFCGKAGKFGSFRGIVIDDYESFERVWSR